MATMMEKAEQMVGHLLRNVHSSHEKMTSAALVGHGDIQVSSDSFDPGMPMAKKYTQDGQSISPALEWAGVPANAVSVVVVCEDPDAPMPEPIVHWIAYNIPARLSELPEGFGSGLMPGAGKQGRNYQGKDQYIGPKPPLGHGVHHYYFQVFALDRDLSFDAPPEKMELVRQMRGHVLAQGEAVGTYERMAE